MVETFPQEFRLRFLWEKKGEKVKTLKFELSGKYAMFKKPDVNAVNLTFGQIHKVALMGLLGAIAGYNGYEQQKKEKAVYPQFYEKLKDIKIAIIPLSDKGYFSKEMRSYTNTTGYANAGSTLIVKDQVLINPRWEIYILMDENCPGELANALQNKPFNCVYIPYLGNTYCLAELSNIEVTEATKTNGNNKIDSLFIKKEAEINVLDDEDDAEPFIYQESLPVALTESTNLYMYKKLCFTNLPVTYKADIYNCNEKTLAFL